VFTNGWRITEEVARRLADFRPLSVEMSLHGGNAATHDRTTGRTGSFAALRQAVERLRALDVPVLLKTILTRLNEAELDSIIAISDEIPLLIDPTVTPCDSGDHAPLRFRASRQAIETLMARLHEVGQLPTARHEPGGFSCGLGRIAITVDPFGTVYPCMQWRESALGNVRKSRLTQIWRHSSVRNQIAKIARMANDRLASIGGAAARFPFCPALAALRTGDPLSLDGDFVMRAEAAEKARRSESVNPERKRLDH
jgi:MoaA/NifB/PqqE/SkfB family radical SAM enzyme